MEKGQGRPNLFPLQHHLRYISLGVRHTGRPMGSTVEKGEGRRKSGKARVVD